MCIYIMSKKYKYWFFYIDDKYLDIVYIEEPNTNLYAYTDDHNIAMKFKKTRNMKIFTMKEKTIDREEVNYLADRFQREKLLLVNYESSMTHSVLNKFEYKLALTQTEHTNIQNIVNQIFVSKIWDTTWINPHIFKDKYVSMLYEIGFAYGYEMIVDKIDITLPQLIHHLFVPDTLGVFIEQYNFLLNKELLK